MSLTKQKTKHFIEAVENKKIKILNGGIKKCTVCSKQGYKQYNFANVSTCFSCLGNLLDVKKICLGCFKSMKQQCICPFCNNSLCAECYLQKFQVSTRFKCETCQRDISPNLLQQWFGEDTFKKLEKLTIKMWTIRQIPENERAKDQTRTDFPGVICTYCPNFFCKKEILCPSKYDKCYCRWCNISFDMKTKQVLDDFAFESATYNWPTKGGWSYRTSISPKSEVVNDKIAIWYNKLAEYNEYGKIYKNILFLLLQCASATTYANYLIRQKIKEALIYFFGKPVFSAISFLASESEWETYGYKEILRSRTFAIYLCSQEYFVSNVLPSFVNFLQYLQNSELSLYVSYNVSKESPIFDILSTSTLPKRQMSRNEEDMGVDENNNNEEVIIIENNAVDNFMFVLKTADKNLDTTFENFRIDKELVDMFPVNWQEIMDVSLNILRPLHQALKNSINFSDFITPIKDIILARESVPGPPTFPPPATIENYEDIISESIHYTTTFEKCNNCLQTAKCFNTNNVENYTLFCIDCFIDLSTSWSTCDVCQIKKPILGSCKECHVNSCISCWRKYFSTSPKLNCFKCFKNIYPRQILQWISPKTIACQAADRVIKIINPGSKKPLKTFVNQFSGRKFELTAVCCKRLTTPGKDKTAICGVCRKTYCAACFDEKTEQHKCDPMRLDLLCNKRNCPNCLELFEKIKDTCPKCYCYNCGLSFDWESGTSQLFNADSALSAMKQYYKEYGYETFFYILAHLEARLTKSDFFCNLIDEVVLNALKYYFKDLIDLFHNKQADLKIHHFGTFIDQLVSPISNFNEYCDKNNIDCSLQVNNTFKLCGYFEVEDQGKIKERAFNFLNKSYSEVLLPDEDEDETQSQPGDQNKTKKN